MLVTVNIPRGLLYKKRNKAQLVSYCSLSHEEEFRHARLHAHYKSCLLQNCNFYMQKWLETLLLLVRLLESCQLCKRLLA